MEPTCVHCGSDKEPYFSRSEPMGDYCSECGHNFYERGTSETDRTERRWRDYSLLNVDDIFDFARRLERERDAERALADRLADALRVAYGLITRHHEVGVTQELGCFCPVCHRDGKEPEMDQIIAALAAWKEARSEV